MISFPPSYTYEELDAQFTSLVSWSLKRRHQRFVVVVDLFAVTSSTPRNRARIARALAEVGAASPFLALGYVVRSVVMRSALTAMHWLTRPAWPVHVFASRDDAVRWAHGIAADRF